MLGGRISATHCRELSAGDLHDPRSDIHTSKDPLGPQMCKDGSSVLHRMAQFSYKCSYAPSRNFFNASVMSAETSISLG